jgi:hypothetical protein
MQTFKQFLSEERKITKLKMDEALDWLIDEYKSLKYIYEMVSTNIPIWRGQNHHGEACIVDVSNAPQRSSANTSNWYTAVLNTSNKWSRYPKRAIIASHSKFKAEGYGSDVYAVFPRVGAKIGVCHSRDIWDSPINSLRMDGRSSLYYVNSHLSYICTGLSLEIGGLPNQYSSFNFYENLGADEIYDVVNDIDEKLKSVNDIQDVCEKAESYALRNVSHSQGKNVIEIVKLIAKNKSIKETIETIFSPDSLETELMTFPYKVQPQKG